LGQQRYFSEERFSKTALIAATIKLVSNFFFKKQKCQEKIRIVEYKARDFLNTF